MNSSVTYRREGTVGVIEIDSPPVNASSTLVRQGLIDALVAAAADGAARSVVLCCAGRTFMAGADIGEFDQPSIEPPDPNDVFAALEALNKTVVAALHGTVLGGGLELALACDVRIASPGTSFGLPEVKLGVLPGAGGTQRLPRLIGIAPAIDLMVSGTPIGADRAQALGLVDEIVDGPLLQRAMAVAEQSAAEGRAKRKLSALPLETSALEADYFAQRRRTLPDEARGGRAAHAVLRCVEYALSHSFADALKFERQAFEACRQSAESKALRHIFFAEREANRIPGIPRDLSPRDVRTVGVIGAGTMGVGITICFVAAGFPVTWVDVSEAALQRGLDNLSKTLATAVQKGRLSEQQMARQLALVTTSVDDAGLAHCDLVVEAAFESMEVKLALCKRLGALCKPGAIIASNTSSLDVDALAAATGRPGDVLGMHFFSPAHVMRLLEVVRGGKTLPEVLTTAMHLARKIHKVAVVSGVCFGFIGNRMLETYLREAEFLLLEGASPSQVDQALEQFGMAMGPCRMIDMAGVDVAAKVVIERKKSNALLTDPTYRVVVQRLHELGRHGQKTSTGYYAYVGRHASDDPAVQVICEQLALAHGIHRRDDLTSAEIVERCLYPLINEGARILEEGIAYRSGDIDTVWINGYGFPAHLGGPMHWAQVVGPTRIADRIKFHAHRSGNRHGYWDACARLLHLDAGA